MRVKKHEGKYKIHRSVETWRCDDCDFQPDPPTGDDPTEGWRQKWVEHMREARHHATQTRTHTEIWHWSSFHTTAMGPVTRATSD